MAIINGKALVKDGKPLDRVYSNGQLVYGRNLFYNKNYPNNPKVQTPGIWSKVYDTNAEKSLSERLIGYEGYVYFSFIFKNPEVIVTEPLMVQLIAFDSSGNRISQPMLYLSKNDLLDDRRVTIPFKLENTKNSVRVEFHIRTVSGSITQNTIIEFEDFKVELGYPTIYTPAPEDYI